MAKTRKNRNNIQPIFGDVGVDSPKKIVPVSSCKRNYRQWDGVKFSFCFGIYMVQALIEQSRVVSRAWLFGSGSGLKLTKLSGLIRA